MQNQFTPGLWRSDLTSSSMDFAVPYLGISHLHGTFREFIGAVETDAEGRVISCSLDIAAASVDTHDTARDSRLLSMDYLDIEAHPRVRFTSHQIVENETGHLLSGTLAINGMRCAVDFQATISGPVAVGGQRRMGIRATGCVSRTAFGLQPSRDPETRAQPDADFVYITFETQVVLDPASVPQAAQPPRERADRA